MSDILKMPSERDGESVADRTRRIMQERPDLVDHLALSVWATDTGHAQGTTAARVAWDALPEGDKNDWRERAWEKCEAGWAMTPAERQLANRASLAKTFAENDRRLKAIYARESRASLDSLSPSEQ